MSLRVIRSAAFVLLMAVCLAGLPRPTLALPRAAQTPSPSAWQDIISYRPPDGVQRAVAARNFGVVPAFVQRVENGIADISLDEFKLNIDRLPNNPASGRQFTATEFFEYVRLNINSFVDPNYAVFRLYDSSRDATWSTTAPEGSLLSIQVSQLLQDGVRKTASVVTADHVLASSHSYWIFSTVFTPGDQWHPLSGNRQFGLRWDGTRYVFYTRAADRITDDITLSAERLGGTVYGGVNATWRSLQQKVALFVNNNGGSATIIPPTTIFTGWGPVCQTYWQPTTPWFDAPAGTPTRDASECNNAWGRTWVPIGMAANYTTGIQVQNLSNVTATVYMRYISSSGGIAASNTIQIQPSATYSSIDQGPAGFQGGVLIQSAQPISVITNLLHKTNKTLASTNAFYSGAPEVNLPLLMRNNYAYSTWFAVQNTHWKSVDVSISYYGASGVLTTENVSIPIGASRFFYQATNTALPNGWVGSGRVRASGAVAVTVLQETSAQLLSYNGFVGGMSNTTISAPIVMANNYGYNSGIQVQNVGVAATNVTVSYGPNTVTAQQPGQPVPCTRYPASRTFSVTVNASISIQQNSTADSQFANCVYVGSATLTASQPILGIVNQVGTIGASAYEAVNPLLTGNRVDLPLLAANNFRVNSGVQIQNVGSSGQYFTFTYSPNTAQPVPNAQNYLPCSSVPSPRSYYIPAGASVTVLQQPDFPSCIYVGGGTITGPSGSRVAAIVNQQGGDYVDKLSTYVGR